MPSSPSAPSGIRTLGTKVYTYDDLYRLTGEQVIGGTTYTKTFAYDPVGNRQTQTTAGSAGSVVTPGVVVYGYDTRDRLLTENGTTYGYDANGNLTTQSGFGTYTFDTENRLVRIAKLDGTLIEHAYDADGVRIRTKTTLPASPTQITNFLVDTSGGLSHVVAESGATGVQTAYYLRALDDLIAVIRPTGTRHYHADGIGSVRKLTDETGTVTDSYEYTAFGEQYEHVGTDPQPYSFAGEPLDPNSGFQYHRARWMQPSTGRFAGMDPWPGNAFEPRSLSRYLYVGADPLNSVDPSGRIIMALVGTKVHEFIGRDFVQGGLRVHNWVPVYQILGIAADGCNDSYGVPAQVSCALRPDLVDLLTAEVYEIKPLHRFWQGFSQLGVYIGVLDINERGPRQWHPGVAYTPPSYFFLPDYGGWDIYVSPPILGVIGYEAVSRSMTRMAFGVVGAYSAARLAASMSSLATSVTSTAFASLQGRLALAVL